MRRCLVLVLSVGLAFLSAASALAGPPLLFDKAEYAARRARLMDRIPDGAAVLLGATLPPGAEFFQNNDLMYLTGVEVPNVVLVIDGRSKTSTLYFRSATPPPATKGSR